MERKRVGDVASIYRGVSYKKAQSSKTQLDNYIAVLRANNISKGVFIDDDLVFVPQDLVSDNQLVFKNDIVITMSSGSKSHVGKVAIARKTANYAFGAFCAKISPYGVDPYYLYYILLSDDFRKHIEAHCKGTNINNIKQSYILDYKIPIPSITKQKQIVKQIEESLSQLDSAVATLNKTKQQLEIYRQAVLKEAFGTFDQTTTIKDVADTRLGKMLDKEKNTGRKRKYLRNINVRWFDFDLSDLLEMRIEDNEIEKYSIKKGDLVMCEGGEPGRCAVWNKDQTIFYQKALHRIRFFDKSNPYFYMYYFWLINQSGFLSKYFTGTGIKHLTGQSLAKVPLPICSREQQDKVVGYIESRFKSIDNIETTIYQSLQQAEALQQSILKQAFNSSLTDTNN